MTGRGSYFRFWRLVGYVGISLGVMFFAAAIFAEAFSTTEPSSGGCSTPPCGIWRPIYPYREYAFPLAAIGIPSIMVGLGALLMKKRDRFNNIRSVLSKQPKATWTEIQARTKIEPEELWHDLKELLDKGEIAYETDGNKSYYSLSAQKRK